MPRTTRAVTYCLIMTGLLTCIATTTAAQGRVRGAVRDRAGNGIAGATISAESLVSTLTFDQTTNDDGRFSLIGLTRGEWLFVIRADGYESVQGFANIRRSGPATTVQFTMELDVFNPPAPSVGALAGIKALDLVESLDAADTLFEQGDYDAAIDRYRSILEQAPTLTNLNLQIGHAFLEKQEPAQALAAYRTALAADPSNAEALAALDAAGAGVR
jgi:tetratricopeptide (TPR) repeat protein